MNYQKPFVSFQLMKILLASDLSLHATDVSIKRLSCHVFRCNDDIFRRGILYILWGIRLDIKKPIVYPEKTAI